MKIIIPCAGRSSRFPNMSPKWMLPDHDGRPMVQRAVEGLGHKIDDLIFAILKEHDDRYGAVQGLKNAFGEAVNVIVLEMPTSSQSETVAETLIRSGITESFIVKDSDNYFELANLEQSFNYVSVASLNDFSKINPQNKGYVQVDQEDIVVNFREKKVISDLFSVGGYYFTSPMEFLESYRELQLANQFARSELYLSEIITFMAMNGHAFKARRVTGYQDWGTIHEWREKMETRHVYLVSIDGFLFEQGSQFFQPAFEDVKPHAIPVETVRKLFSAGHSIRYLSIRPRNLAALTRHQLAEQALPEAPIMFECDIGRWTLLTAPHPNLPFTTSQAVEIAIDDPNMAERLI